MKQFVKFTFASCLGSIMALSLLLIFLLGIMGSTAEPMNVADNSVLHVKLNFPVPELTDNVAVDQFQFEQKPSLGLNDIVRVLRHAKNNDKIRSILIQTEAVSMNPTSAYVVAREIESFKSSGKPVLAYGDYFTQSGYIIASAADSVFLNPNGLVDLRGYGMVIPYYQEFSDRFGFRFDVYHAGKFKSAVEPYYRNESSNENRLQAKQFLGRFHNALVDHISSSRDTDKYRINEIIKEGLSTHAAFAKENNLVDGLKYEDEFISEMKDELDLTKIKKVDLQYYHQTYPRKTENHDDRIAVVYAEGEVAFGGNTKGNINMAVYDKLFDRLIKNKRIKSVVLRINSPGGSHFTSDKFWKRVEDLKASGKYVVASFGDYAASGGYYIASGADKIVSEPTTLTGSIGAYSLLPDFYEASKKNLSINWDTIGTGRKTFIYSSFVPRSEEDNKMLQIETERVYRQFLNVVSEGREMELEDLSSIAQGRVWSGIDAVGIGLVDTLGTLDDAISIAAEGASIEEYKVLEYPIIKKTFLEQVLEQVAEGTQSRIYTQQPLTKLFTGDFKRLLDQIEAACSEPQFRLPFHISVN